MIGSISSPTRIVSFSIAIAYAGRFGTIGSAFAQNPSSPQLLPD